MSVEERKKIIDKYFQKFTDETDYPRKCVKDKLGQFICVGKLKKTYRSSWQRYKCGNYPNSSYN